MRIDVLVTDAFGGRGGIAKFNRDLLTALCSHPRCEGVAAFPRLMPEPPGALPEKLAYATEGINGKLRYILCVLKHALCGPKADLLICGHINLLPVARLLQMINRAPLILVIHGIEAWRPTGSPLANRCARNIKTVVAVSDFTRQRFFNWKGLGADASYILPNAIAMEEFGSGAPDPGLVERYGLHGRTVIMTLARLSAEERYKGIDEVLEALPGLAVNVPNLTYLIAGDGNDRGRLEKKAAELGVKERVIFTGRILEGEKAAHYQLADAFVMPGWGEGFGIVYLEAMACGIPVVAGKHDASREALRNGELGILVDPKNRVEVHEGILEALGRPKGIVPEGLEYFSFSNFRQRCHAIVDQVLDAA